MPRYVTHVKTPWEPARAFEYLVDLEHFADWDPGVTKATRVGITAPGLGAEYDVTVKNAGREQTLGYTTVAAEAPNRIEVRAETAMLRSVDVMTIEPDPAGGCAVTYDADLSLKGIAVLGTPLLALAFKRIGDRAAEGLRRVLEGQEA